MPDFISKRANLSDLAGVRKFIQVLDNFVQFGKISEIYSGIVSFSSVRGFRIILEASFSNLHQSLLI
jgi:hypothetical protein